MNMINPKHFIIKLHAFKKEEEEEEFIPFISFKE